jgi:RND superfamily putative drug exporter
MTDQTEDRHILQWIILIAWLIIAAFCLTFIYHVELPFKIGSISDPQSESWVADSVMKKKLPYGASRIFILYTHDKWSVQDPRFSSEVKKSLKGLDKFPLQHRIVSPYNNSAQISENKHSAYAVVVMEHDNADKTASTMQEFYQSLGTPHNLKMYVGGEPTYISDVNDLSQSNLIRGEMIALPLSIIALIFIFRGVLAAFLPVITGVISIAGIISILIFLGHQFDLSVFVLNIATMLGLGLSLDYTLLITYRFREELSAGKTSKEAMQVTLNTAGKAIFFSGLIVLISMSSLLFFSINVLYSIGIGGVVVVIITVFTSLTLLPAILCILGERVNIWPITLLGSVHLNESVHENAWYRITKYVMQKPLRFLFPTIIFLLILGYPFLHVRLNSSDATILPTWTESRSLLDNFKKNFNPNAMTPIEILIKTEKNNSILTKRNISLLYDYAHELKKDPRVKRIESIVTISPSLSKEQYIQIYGSNKLPFNDFQKQFFHDTTKGKYTLMMVISKYPSNDQKTFDLVRTIRENAIENHFTQQVTGNTAIIVDTIHSSYQLFLKTIGIISLVTYIVLLILLRSIILPLKAILMNFLSLSVCYGMLVFIFQEGHLSHLLNFQALGNTDLNLPILLFFTLFGLSMDYEVFLMTRIKEFYDKTHDNMESVALGIERSARIITAAAVIVVIVCFAFATADIVFIKAFAVGAALAVIVDVSIIRLLLVPATMRLMGDWNWYLPKWLDRILPKIELKH